MVCKRRKFLSFIYFALNGLKFWMHVSNIHVEGTVSQISDLGLSCFFMSKNG